MPNFRGSENRPICSGAGFVALDLIFTDSSQHKPRYFVGGSCGNVLTILSYLGWTSYPISRIGNDLTANRIIRDLEKWHVRTDFIKRDPKIRTPIVVERIKLSKKPVHKFEWNCPKCGNPLPRFRPLINTKYIIPKIPPSQVFYFDRLSRDILELVRIQRALNALIVFEPTSFGKRELFIEALKLAHIVKYSRLQIRSLDWSGIIPPLEIQTLGEKGLRFKSNVNGHAKDWNFSDAYHLNNFIDSSGAGDWCTAGIIHTIGNRGACNFTLSNDQIVDAIRFGQCLAAIKCNYEGARGLMYKIKRDKLVSMIRNMNGHGNWINISEDHELQRNMPIQKLCPLC